MYVPTKVFFTKGVGKHKEYLASFELALRDAGIEKCNLVSVSSIYPVGCKIIDREEGLKLIQPGQITFAVIARNSTNEPSRLIASSIGVALPADPSMYGYLSEHHPYGEDEKKAGDYAEDLAASMLASTLGIEFDAEQSWDEKEQVFKLSGQIVRTFNITQTSEGDETGSWTTVISAAILLP
ncbi:MAG TPA: arginine decarboxylase, pyruvoyl-dependent [Ignavibacteriales bacterium]|nr:arginine decarboxylase, pyruvoyl-dependent [Ignavibacteriales bacterium]HPD66908.1 arginine decarboxylase, pyruvoyl-dependent [Ignavibacteriales bacterium]HRR18585.1 arginine decarboxylase, pyruvoyl-dependent [Ignavibacteriales bacterium]HRT98290.1 arginine decarboxylase, pyruvoyl-dependent [Ignavibacteriales bacterium]